MSVCLSFVLPTKNEQATIGDIIDKIRAEVDLQGYQLNEIIIVDDSSDSTRSIAASKGVTVLPGENRGLGYAMKKGLLHSAQTKSTEIVVSLDSDGQTDIKELARFVNPIEADQADLVIASRFLEKNNIKYKYPRINRFGVYLLSQFLSWQTGTKITDSHGGIRAMKSKIAKNVNILGDHTYVQEAILDAHQRGYRILEISSVWLQRQSGESRVVRSIPRYIMRTLPILLIRANLHILIPCLLGTFTLLFFFFVNSSSMNFLPMFLTLCFFLSSYLLERKKRALYQKVPSEN